MVRKGISPTANARSNKLKLTMLTPKKPCQSLERARREVLCERESSVESLCRRMADGE